MDNIRTIVADPYPVARKGLQTAVLKAADMTLVGAVENGAEALDLLRRLQPQVAVIELDMARLRGIEVIEVARRQMYSTRFLILTTPCNGTDIQRAIRAGASGYLSKSEPIDRILRAIRDVGSGGTLLSEQARTALKTHIRIPDVEPPDTLLLDKIEREVLNCFAQGLSISETARLMCLSVSTVKHHRAAIFSKLNVPNAPAAVYAAVCRGILR